jgi:hypothetical protein
MWVMSLEVLLMITPLDASEVSHFLLPEAGPIISMSKRTVSFNSSLRKVLLAQIAYLSAAMKTRFLSSCITRNVGFLLSLPEACQSS